MIPVERAEPLAQIYRVVRLSEAWHMRDDLFGDRLLVIDDEPALGNTVKRIAQGCGFEVVVTETPPAFLSAARLWRPTVIVLDLKIPGSDGIELLRTLAADKCPAQIIV